MARRLPHLLAIVLACSTVLAGVPSIAAAAVPDPLSGPCVGSCPVDPEGVSESRGATIEEEREEKEGADTEVDLFARPPVAVVIDVGRRGLTTLASFQAATGSFEWGRSIRGPPAG